MTLFIFRVCFYLLVFSKQLLFLHREDSPYQKMEKHKLGIHRKMETPNHLFMTTYENNTFRFDLIVHLQSYFDITLIKFYISDSMNEIYHLNLHDFIAFDFLSKFFDVGLHRFYFIAVNRR